MSQLKTIALSVFFFLFSLLLIGQNPVESTPAGQTSSTVSYIASGDNFANPERGFYHYLETRASNPTSYDLAQLTAYRVNEDITLTYCIHYLDSFVDSPISAAFLSHIESNLETLRQAGLKCILRFAYTDDWNDETPPYGDATKAQILDHIDQLQPILEANADVIALMQAGFIGVWGEWYYTQHFVDDPAVPWVVSEAQWQNRRDVLEAEMSALPNRFVAVRYAHAKTELFSTNTPLTMTTAYDSSSFARTTFHNDCFLASDTDFGTYLSPADRQFMVDDNQFGAMGGESCNVNPPRSECTTALAELKEFHFSYLNIEYEPDVLAGWEASGCFEKIQKELGYRLELIEGDYDDAVQPDDQFGFSLKLKNAGYAAPFNERPVEVLLRDSTQAEKVYRVALPDDPRYWFSDDVQMLDYNFCVPASIDEGDYDLLLNLPDAADSLNQNPAYSILVANSGGVQEASTGFNNLLHSITVSSDSQSADCSSDLVFEPLFDVPIALGDVSCDDLTNTIDALFILQFNVGLRTDTPSCPLLNSTENLYANSCDVNADTNCNTIDALFILQCNVNLNNSFCPME